MANDRAMWIERLDRVARPVMTHLATRTLRANMPVEHHVNTTDRADTTHLEAFGRLASGLAPWLALPEDALAGPEKSLHAEYRRLLADAVAAGLDDASPDRLNFEKGQQALVDAAFLAHAIIRAPTLFHALPRTVVGALASALKSTRTRKPPFTNWLLFSAMIEAGLHVLGEQPDLVRVDYAVRQHEQWYMGGGVYGDGPDYHADYYNSFVIQPMLIDVLRTLQHADAGYAALLQRVIVRGQRYAEILERSVAPDGSFPPTGRSITYRCGAFQHLAQMALQHALPASLPPAKVRGVLTSVIRRTLDAPNTFDANGWLRIGLGGAQPSLGEPYISTGSLYLCAAAFLPLGLGPKDDFWSGAAARSSWSLAWSGQDVAADHG